MGSMQFKMGKPSFRADLLKAGVPGLFPHLTNVGKGEDDSSIRFTYNASLGKYGFDIEATVIGK